MNDNFGVRTFEEEVASVKGLNQFIAKVFGWMFLGLMATAGVAFYVASNETLIYNIVSNRILFYGLMIGELALVMMLSARITKLSFPAAMGFFVGYAVLNGVTLSTLFYAFTGGALTNAFAITAVTFGVMSIYGYFTQADLTRFRSLLFMGLIGVVVLSVVNLFLRSSSLEWFVSLIGLFVFLGLTAYDMQKLKGYYYHTEGNVALRNNLGVAGALNLYLDFINLFLIFLRIFGRRD